MVTHYNSDQSSGTSISVDIGAKGNNRLVSIMLSDESSHGAVFQGTITVDGKPCTQKIVLDNSDGLGNHTELHLIDEQALGNSEGTVFIAYDAGDAGWGISVNVHYGVRDEIEIDSGTYNATNPGTTATILNIDTEDGSLVLMGAHNSDPTVAFSSWTSPLIERSDDTSPNGPAGARMGTASGIETTGQTNKSYSVTAANQRWTVFVITFAAAEITVEDVTSDKANGQYKAKDSLFICTEFSEHVSVGGNPRLNLDVYPNGRQAHYMKPWTPEYINSDILEAWYDASDLDTITESADSVSQWDDKSGNNLHLTQGTGSLQPQTNVKQINGLNAIEFTQQWMSTSSNPFGANVVDAEIFFVLKCPTTIMNGTGFSLTGSDTAANRWQAHLPWGSEAIIFDNGGTGGGNRLVANSALVANEIAVISLRGSVTDGIQAIYKNGSLLISDATGHTVATVGNIFLGTGEGITMQDFEVGEVLILNGVVPSELRNNITGYLSWKWGQVTSLPGGHVFKNRPPLVWQPVLMNLDSWHDAADNNTILHTSNSVDQWLDKSGNGRHVKQTGSNRPITNSISINGLNTIAFNGSSHWMRSDQKLTWLNNKQYTILGVARCDAASGVQFICGGGQTVLDKGLHIGYSSTNVWRHGHLGDDGDTSFTRDSNVMLSVNKYNKPGSQMDRNGTPQTSAALPSGDLIITDNPYRIGQGYRTTVNGFWNGPICEILTIARLLTSQESELLQGYLAWKWGTVSLLSSSRTYKNFAPAI
ncbi:MAG: hypothetical protein R3209_06300 [Salinimicrobium sediminis]|nr:hypothetical protein [Salinimicrobium sediminis]